MHVNVVTNTLQGQIDTSLKMGYDQTNGTGACNAIAVARHTSVAAPRASSPV